MYIHTLQQNSQLLFNTLVWAHSSLPQLPSMTCAKCNDSAVVTSAQQVLHEHSYIKTCCSWLQTQLVSTSAQLAP